MQSSNVFVVKKYHIIQLAILKGQQDCRKIRLQFDHLISDHRTCSNNYVV